MNGQPTMTAREAAIQILQETGIPMSVMDLASKMLKRRMVTSKAEKKEQSIANTISQSINGDDEHILEYKRVRSGESLVGLREWGSIPWWGDVTLEIPVSLYKSLMLAQYSGLKPSLEETIILLLESGLKQEQSKIKEGLMEQVENFQG